MIVTESMSTSRIVRSGSYASRIRYINIGQPLQDNKHSEEKGARLHTPLREELPDYQNG